MNNLPQCLAFMRYDAAAPVKNFEHGFFYQAQVFGQIRVFAKRKMICGLHLDWPAPRVHS